MVAHRLGQDEQYLTVREILSEPSTGAGGMLSRERSDFCRFGFATLGFTLSTPEDQEIEPWRKISMLRVAEQVNRQAICYPLDTFLCLGS